MKPAFAVGFGRSLAEVALMLLAVAVLALYVPARRSLRIDPMLALQQE
jgi:ABC-type antimicrobial peptide transport system permease subunit